MEVSKTRSRDTQKGAQFRPWTIGISGASGTIYARRLVELVLNAVPDFPLDIVVTEAALRVMREEDGLPVSIGRLSLEQLIYPTSLPTNSSVELIDNEISDERSLVNTEFNENKVARTATGKAPTLRVANWGKNVRFHSNRNIGASIASGSYLTAGMVILPCSMKTLAGVAHGYSDNLLQRAADVTLKEGRRLIMVPRETPFSEIHLENMLRLTRAGVRIVPAMPGFYQQPTSIMDLVDTVVSRVIDQMDQAQLALGLPALGLDVHKRWDEIVEDRKALGDR